MRQRPEHLQVYAVEARVRG
jgi:transposase